MAALFAVMEFLCTFLDPQYRDMWMASVPEKRAGACDVCSRQASANNLSHLRLSLPDRGMALFYVI